MSEVPTSASPFFVVSGTLPLDSHSYVPRQADKDLLSALLAGEYCFVLNSRQMGKSSLSVRTMAKLQAAGVRTVFLDLTKFGGSNVTPEQWYIGLLSETGRSLGLRKEFLAYWKENAEYSLVQRYIGALHDVGLQHLDFRIVLFVDEIDAIKSLSFSTDEFFAAVRECYNRRVQEPEYGRLAFALVGSATASDLIKDTRTSPFNIGKRIELKDFTAQEALPLAEGIDRPNAKALVERAFYWTNGHPFLTQALCAEIAQDNTVQQTADVDRLTEQMFFEAKARERNVNLSDVSNRILSSYLDPDQKEEHRAAILDLYRQVRSGRGRVSDDETNRLVTVLKLSGITRSVNGELQVRNRIYERVFDKQWIEQSMPDAERRRQQTAYRKGLLRAVSLSSVIILALATLTLYALLQKKSADSYARSAKNNEKRANENTAIAKKLADDRSAALRQAQNSAAVAISTAKQRDVALKDALTKKQLADLSAKAARVAEGHAKTETARAHLAQTQAKTQAETASRYLYISNMNLIQQAWESTPIQFGRMRELLNETARYPNRGFEWFYWNRLCHMDVKTISVKGRVMGYSPDRQSVLTTETSYGHIYNLQSGKETLLHDARAGLLLYAMCSANGKRILTQSAAFLSSGFLGNDYSVQVWDAQTGKEFLTFKLPNGYHLQALSPDGTRILVSNFFISNSLVSNSSSMQLLDGQTGKPLLTIDLSKLNYYAAAFSPDGKQIVVGSSTGMLLLDAQTGKEIRALKGQTSPIVQMAFSPDGSRIVSYGSDITAKIWDVQTGKETLTLSGHTSAVTSVAFSPDGRSIVTGSGDRTAKVWDAQTGRELSTFRGHSTLITSVVFSPDGKRLLTGGDNEVKIWDVHRQETLEIVLAGNFLRGVAFLPKEERVVTMSFDQTGDTPSNWRMIEPFSKVGCRRGWFVRQECHRAG